MVTKASQPAPSEPPTKAERRRRRAGDLDPNPEIWAALRNGDGLREVLQDFYTRVYDDERLAHFFDGTTKQRAIEKQFNFLMQIFTGERCYFGERPRNAHHWMVISDELYDYREELMESCLRRYGMPEPLVKQWRAMEECFRKQIVKDAPRPKKIRGVSLPLDGYGRITLDVGSICDGCQANLDQGASARYHNRTGQMYCTECVPGTTSTRPPPPTGAP